MQSKEMKRKTSIKLFIVALAITSVYADTSKPSDPTAYG